MMGANNCTKPPAKSGDQPPRVEAEMTVLRLESANAASIRSSDPPPPDARPRDAGPETRYVFTGLHAEGGIGRVWLARDRQLDREVAVKELFPENAGNAKLAARFVREAQLTGQLEHPGVVPVYELDRGAEANRPFYAMKFVRGRTLRSAVDAYHS